MIPKPMHCQEIADRLGVALDTFYRRRHQYTLCDGMPAPIARTGRPAYDRAGMEAWLTRHDPRRPPLRPPANDQAPPLMPRNDAEWTDFLHRHYGPCLSG